MTASAEREGDVMLARTAEYLFWSGRYLERAESTARLLDVTYHRLLEVTPAEEAEAWSDLLVSVGLEADYVETGYPRTAAPVSEFLVHGPDNPGSIVASVAQARDNARGVREHLPMELWESLNSLHLNLGARDLDDDLAMQPFELYGFVRTGIQGVMGCATESWSREDAWRFFMLGLLLERAEMCVRTLRVRHPRHQPDAVHEWSATLRSASALQAYRRQYRTSSRGAGRAAAAVADVAAQRAVLAAPGRGDPRRAQRPSDGRLVRSGSDCWGGCGPSSSSPTPPSSPPAGFDDVLERRRVPDQRRRHRRRGGVLLVPGRARPALAVADAGRTRHPGGGTDGRPVRQ